ncbi:MAG: hypothetical protein AAB388_01385 [Patescibacteria group bacterium]
MSSTVKLICVVAVLLLLPAMFWLFERADENYTQRLREHFVEECGYEVPKIGSRIYLTESNESGIVLAAPLAKKPYIEAAVAGVATTLPCKALSPQGH